MAQRVFVLLLQCFCNCLYVVCMLFVIQNSGVVVLPVGAATMRIDNMPLGKVISINGQKFAKVRNDPANGSQFVALEKVRLPCIANQFNGMNMQDFTTDDCNCLPKPTGTGYTLAGIMKDARDGKSYEVRKFADGKCWMVDNLAYGGATDACATKTAFVGNTNLSGAAWGYGDCRNNQGSPTYGYLYNWQAAMQHDSARWNAVYTGPTTNVQGICPTGWHLPTRGVSGTTGESQNLHIAAGSPTTGFWQGGNWKGVLSGYCTVSGGLTNQGSYGYYWSNMQKGRYLAFIMRSNEPIYSGDHAKFYGTAVRCIKN